MKAFVLAGLALGLIGVPVAASATPSAPAQTTPSAFDRYYLQTSIQADLAEIVDGNYALKHGSNTTVISLAKRVINDHNKALKASIATAHGLHLNTPTVSIRDWL